jgi:hypothetical protein
VDVAEQAADGRPQAMQNPQSGAHLTPRRDTVTGRFSEL